MRIITANQAVSYFNAMDKNNYDVTNSGIGLMLRSKRGLDLLSFTHTIQQFTTQAFGGIESVNCHLFTVENFL
jgi:hypothetical protein